LDAEGGDGGKGFDAAHVFDELVGDLAGGEGLGLGSGWKGQ
jgi:hypothetical protein